MQGHVIKASGPTVTAAGMSGCGLNEVVHVGQDGLLGEVIRLEGDTAFVQVYEDTGGITIGAAVEGTGKPLAVELGPGIMGMVFDGIQRPLEKVLESSGHFIAPGLSIPAVDRQKCWDFSPNLKTGDRVGGGTILGTVQETMSIEHRVLAPPLTSGVVKEIRRGSFSVTEAVVILEDGQELTMMQTWPVKRPRPIRRKLDPSDLFVTGQRVLDFLFPLALGGVAIAPGGFGTGKTVVEQMLAKHANADCVVYVGCGERGNEMTDMLSEFPHLTDPRTGSSLMDRSLLIANTSNMPVAAREASIYTGVTIAEYYRDMGYDVAMMADSTSRWAEALREISSRLEELPGEEGYPTYLATRLAKFYERAGRVEVLGSGRKGSVTLVGAVSPPGGDFSEPVTQCSMRVCGTVWSLDSTLAYRRHYPAINWNRSYSLYLDLLDEWYQKNAPPGWADARRQLNHILEQDARIQEVVQLIGPDALQAGDRLLLEISRMVREIFLQQNAFSQVDACCGLDKQLGLLQCILECFNQGQHALEQGAMIEDITALNLRERIARLCEVDSEAFAAEHRNCKREISEKIATLDRHEDLHQHHRKQDGDRAGANNAPTIDQAKEQA